MGHLDTLIYWPMSIALSEAKRRIHEGEKTGPDRFVHFLHALVITFRPASQALAQQTPSFRLGEIIQCKAENDMP